MKCSICGREIKGMGNNAAPFCRDRCCDDCDNFVVLPMRMWLMGCSPKNVLLLEVNNQISYLDTKTTESFKLLLKRTFKKECGISLLEENDQFVFYKVVDMNNPQMTIHSSKNNLLLELFGLDANCDVIVGRKATKHRKEGKV